jgi:hypothetical protein
MAPPLSQDRLVRKEVALGVIREFEPPQTHMGLRLLAPYKDVQSDDVIFSYTHGLTAGLAPARAEDAESELAGKDDSVGSGRASLIDWALKDHYDASDVTRYREGMILGGLAGAENLSLVTQGITEDWQNKIARDTMLRRRKLDNRMEQLIMSAIDTGVISYNDGKIIFNVDFGRPADQQDMVTPSGILWSASTADPIGDIMAIQQDAEDTYGVDLDRVIISKRIARNLRKSEKFVNSLIGSNPLYAVVGWGDQAAMDFIEQQTGVTFIVYDAVYRTKALGSNTIVNNRFTRDDKAIFLPSANTVAELAGDVGFGATLTSPHPEGNWTPGFYEWERSTVDPWGHDMGAGIKAFPVLPHLDLTYVVDVL